MGPASRWTNTDADAELDAQVKQQKEERRLKKLQKATKSAQEKRSDKTVVTASKRTTAEASDDDETAKVASSTQPAKRQKIHGDEAQALVDDENGFPMELLNPDIHGWSQSRSITDYTKLNDIEEGTYGWVTRASQCSTGKVVAMKRLKLDTHDNSGLPVTGLREIQILQSCKHRNIVSLEEVVVGEDISRLDNSVYLVMEFVEHDLKGILDDMPEPFLASEIKSLLKQLVSGTDYLHENWIIHRDLKTSNLLLNNRGQLKIADFGMARYVSEPPPKLTQLVVTLWYRAPELLLGTTTYDSAIDMWSVGCIFGELITREPLLQGKNEVDQISKTFELCGVPSEETWPMFRRLPNARKLQLPKTASSAGNKLRTKFTSLTSAGVSLLTDLLALNPQHRPSASKVLQHLYFAQDPKPKPESMFPTFPSKAGRERTRRVEPNAPVRGQTTSLRDADFSGIFQRRDQEERGAGFSLRMG